MNCCCLREKHVIIVLIPTSMMTMMMKMRRVGREKENLHKLSIETKANCKSKLKINRKETSQTKESWAACASQSGGEANRKACRARKYQSNIQCEQMDSFFSTNQVRANLRSLARAPSEQVEPWRTMIMIRSKCSIVLIRSQFLVHFRSKVSFVFRFVVFFALIKMLGKNATCFFSSTIEIVNWIAWGTRTQESLHNHFDGTMKS